MLVFFTLGALGSWLIFADPLGLGVFSGSAGETAKRATFVEQPTLHQCPMHPEVVQDHPGDCPICGMPLVEIEPEGATADTSDGRIMIDPVQVQNIGVVSVEARRSDIARTSRSVGILDYDSERTHWVNTKYEGWVEDVYVEYVGQEVEQGEPLFEVYSPTLVTTQEEYLQALEYRARVAAGGDTEATRNADRLVKAARERLEHWDVSDGQILRLETEGTVLRRMAVRSPASGVVAEVMNDALEGMRVTPGMNLYRIADLSRVWVHADVVETEIPWMRAGLSASVSIAGNPTESYNGEVLFLYPEVSEDSRTLRVCLEVPNPRRDLRPGMYANVRIEGPTIRDAIVVPQSAIIRSGERNIVFIDLGEGRFEPREIELGVRGRGDLQQVVRGVQPGERVVTQAQFMLDSESRMQEAIEKFRARGSSGSAQPPGSGHVH
jgi:Cu(I)/Ag(I) efflux system membrane fusion protein/cobalt-zinc-cadmium efflux system membrane fusion protein